MRDTNRPKKFIKINTECAYIHGNWKIFKPRGALEYTNKLNVTDKLDDEPDLMNSSIDE